MGGGRIRRRSTRGTAEAAIAIHEAGHAVAAYRRHIATKLVSIVPADDYVGVHEHYVNPSMNPYLISVATAPGTISDRPTVFVPRPVLRFLKLYSG